jgi:hypothetical protein
VTQKEPKHPFDPTKGIRSHALHVLEKGPCASVWIRRNMKRLGLDYSATQMSGALQKLKAEGLVSYNAAWELAGDALAGSLRDSARSKSIAS